MQIVTKPMFSPHATLLYSPPGVGKTEFAAFFPKPVFMMINLETGLRTLIESGRVPYDTAHFPDPIYTFDELLKTIDYLARAKHDHQTAVIDTMNSVELLLKRHVTKKHFFGREDKFDAFAKGWERCAEPWDLLLHQLNRLKARGMRVLCLAHSEVSVVRNPDGEDYQSHTPLINKKVLWVPLNAWCDNVFFMNLEICEVTDKAQQATKDKNHRLLYVQAGAGHFAKNRLSLTKSISMGTCGREGVENFRRAVMEARGNRPVTPPADHKDDKKPETQPTEPVTTEKPPEDTKPADTKPTGPVAPLTGVREGEPVPEFVQTFLKRVSACKRFGIAMSLWPDIVTAYDKAPESDQIDHYPEIIKFWTTKALELANGEEKYITSIVKRIEERSDLPTAKARALLKLPASGDE